MIVAGRHPLPIGKPIEQSIGLRHDGVLREFQQPVTAIRAATFEEWLNQPGVGDPPTNAEVKMVRESFMFFYEIITD